MSRVLDRIEAWWIGMTQPSWHGPYCPGCGRPWESAVTTYLIQPATTTTYRCAQGHEWTPRQTACAGTKETR